MAVGELTEIEASTLLNDLRLGLNADGYDLQVSRSEGKMQLRIVVAREDACEECLVPKNVMGQIAVMALQEKDSGITAEDIVLQYPAER